MSKQAVDQTNLTIRLPKALIVHLRAVADADARTLSSLIRYVLSNYVADKSVVCKASKKGAVK